MKIIPAIDIINGQCVRLTQGNYQQAKIYSNSPLEIAKRFEDCGIKYLHLVDLDGAKSNKIVNYKILELLATNTNLKIDFGGGIKSKDDLVLAFNCGAYQVTVGSVAASNQNLFLEWLSEFGNDKIILGADAQNRKIALQGWLQQTDWSVTDFIAYYQTKGVKYVICTDISKDGMLQGPSTELYTDILKNANIKLIASGGVCNINDINKLKNIGCYGVIIGKALYENKITLEQLQFFL